MTTWWLVMFGGLLGSSHCVGMCGGFAAIVGLRSGTLANNLRAQLIYSCGRLMSYSTLGAVAGFAGKRIMASAPRMINVPAVLSLIAGAFLIYQGLHATGLIRRRITGSSAAGCLLAPLFSTILRLPGARNTFVAGIVTGFLPCGLVYAFVSLAASSSNPIDGAITMLAFGLGTVPLMVVTGCGVTFLGWAARQRLWKMAAWSVIVTGMLTLGRGISFLQVGPEIRPASCPFCTDSKAMPVESISTESSTSHETLFVPKPSSDRP